MEAVVVDQQIEQYVYDNGDMTPVHPNAYLEPPCCTSPDPDTGHISCGCGGQPMIVCPAIDCPGITADEAESIMERLQ